MLATLYQERNGGELGERRTKQSGSFRALQKTHCGETPPPLAWDRKAPSLSTMGDREASFGAVDEEELVKNAGNIYRHYY